jgi:uncharacterized protein YndB with AHSA1/START domain
MWEKNMTGKRVHHATFCVERKYSAPVGRVFAAFADPAIKRRWFAEGENWTLARYDAEFRVGGHEYSTFHFKDGPVITNDTIYLDIVENSRIVIAYTMAAEGVRFSSSLATVKFVAAQGGTTLTYTEQMACLDGEDQSANRKSGCTDLFETLASELDRKAAAA